MRKGLLLFSLFFLHTFVYGQTWQQLDSLGLALTAQNLFNEADSIFKIALKEAEAQHGADTSYAKVSYNLGRVYYFLGSYDKAEKLWVTAKQIREQYHGKRHFIYAKSCNALGIVYQKQGLYEKAEPFYLEAKEIWAELLGEKHPDYASACNNLASLYMLLGFYDKAESLYLETKSIFEETLGKNHPSYASLCNNLASLYNELGLYDKAELIYLEGKAIQEHIFGNKHPDYANSCQNLAILYRTQGKYDKVEPLYLEAKGIIVNVFGKKHPKYASLCNNLAVLYASQKVYDKAEALFFEASGILESISDKKSPEYTNSCNNLAQLYADNGFYDKAELFHIEAKNIIAEIFGKNHPDYANSCNNLANLYQQQTFYEKAEPLYFEAIQNKCEEIKTLFPSFSEQEKIAYWQAVRVYFNSFSLFAKNYSEQKPTIMADLYNQTLFTKGIIFSSSQRIKEAILNSADTVLINKFNDWKKRRITYNKLYLLPLEVQKEQNLDLKSIKNEINDLEKELSKKSELFGQSIQTKSYKWQDVKAELTKDEVLIEIVKTGSAYIALFLTAQTESYPTFCVFESAQDLEGAYLNFYRNCINFKIEDTVSYTTFWKPIADKLQVLNKKGFKKIYFSPDGVFHQLSLNTLRNPKTDQFLLEEASIQLIGSSRDLIELSKKSRALNQNYNNYQAHLLGYPTYGSRSIEPTNNSIRTASFSRVQSAVGMAGSVALLPGTKKEVENIFALFKEKKLNVNLLLAENATEEAVKNLKSPTILHVATHGFFMPEIAENEVKDIQTAMNRTLLKNPFMRSGLLLAGSQMPVVKEEDGILTAEEVMNLTLDNTELVVMSACETGLGDVQTGEGVFGLQRAFQQAGAKSVLMSLWKVDDEATQTLMTAFYTALLKGQSKRHAFKTAQLKLKKRFPEPYYWGAFVLVGE